MLPDRLDKTFPSALKKAREDMKLSLTELAVKAGISATMPGRYENPESALHGVPSLETWKKLNQVLTPSDNQGVTDNVHGVYLADATIDQLVQQLKNKGVKAVSLDF